MSKQLLVTTLMIMAVLFKAGLPIKIGIGDNAPLVIPIPQSDIAFYAFLWGAIVWIIPGYWIAKVSRYFKRQKRLHLTGPNLKRLLTKEDGSQ